MRVLNGRVKSLRLQVWCMVYSVTEINACGFDNGLRHAWRSDDYETISSIPTFPS